MTSSSLLAFLLCIAVVSGFAPPPSVHSSSTGLHMGKIANPLQELGDMFSSMDDVIDDFFNKRMGNGEVFYGKRKYKPSGKVEGQYQGMGLTDKQRIEDTKEHKELWMQRNNLSEDDLKKRP